MKHSVFKSTFAVTLVFVIFGCSTGNPTAPQTHTTSRAGGIPRSEITDAVSGRESAAWLTEMDAESRLNRIKDLHYDLNFEINRDSEEFKGDVTVSFNLDKQTDPLTMDFEDGQIESVTDPKSNAPIAYQFAKHFITFPAFALREGGNSVRIQYHRAYSKSGDGFYRFKDPEDHEVYVYTNFEPYHANGLFPCFDQPSLKATYKIQVTAPNDWSVISSTLESGKKAAGPLAQTWNFPNSKPFSTYLVSVVAGPFQTWSDHAGDIPIRLLARKSLAKYVLHQEWLNITKQGLDFYQKYFDFKYPFAKFDQILVPDFNAGAMENVGAVTFSERYIIRGIPTDIERENLSVTVLHEMAHMWFGDLVTMKWWNGLWLNESFATFMSYEATAKATRFKSAWESFHLGRKQWGYLEDQYVTTHPIETPVESTDVASSNFDGITYAKGASVLKQINYYLTPEKFRAGVRLYFKKNQFKNTTADDFFQALSQVAGLELRDWTNAWLRTSGLNSVEALYACTDKKIDSLEIKQSGAPGFLAFRPERLNLALFTEQTKSIKTLSVISNQADLLVEAGKGMSCPAVVFPNYDDEAYIKVQLDDQARHHVVSMLMNKSEIGLNSLTRSQFWTTYWDTVRDGKVAAEEYLQHASVALGTEKDERISTFLLESLVHSRSVSYIRSALFYLPNEGSRHEWRVSLEKTFIDLLKRKDLSLDLRRSVYDAYIRVVTTPAKLTELLEVLKTHSTFEGIEIDHDRRWTTLIQLARNEAPGVTEAIESEKKSDSSHSAQQSAISASVVVPEFAAKEVWLNRFVQDSSLSAADVRSASAWMFADEQESILKSELPKIRIALNSLAKNRESSFSENAVRGLLPVDGETETSQFLRTWWNQDHDWLPTIVERALRVSIQENEITQRNRKVVSTLTPVADPSTSHP